MLENQIAEHNGGEVPSTKSRRPLRLVYYEACLNKIDAAAREKYLKTGMGKRYMKNRLKDSPLEALRPPTGLVGWCACGRIAT